MVTRVSKLVAAVGAVALGLLGTTSLPLSASAAPDDTIVNELADIASGRVVVDTTPATVRVLTSASNWGLSVDTTENSIVAQSSDGPIISIDYDGPTDDSHRVGMTPDTGCGPMEGNFWGATTSLIYPILNPDLHEIEDVWVVTNGANLWVLMSGGSYQILDPTAQDKPLFTGARFSMNGDSLRAELAGLYYLLPSKDPGTSVSIQTADSNVANRNYTMSSPSSVEYFDDVRSMAVADGSYGDFDITTSIDRLQVEVNSNPALNVFELDLDHTFKDLGQEIVVSRIDFESSPCLS